MENRLLVAAAAGLFGGFGLSHLNALDGRLSDLEQGGQRPPDALQVLSRRLVELEGQLGRVAEDLDRRTAELQDREQELRAWRERRAEALEQTVQDRLEQAERAQRDRWQAVERELAEAAVLARANECRLEELGEPAPERLVEPDPEAETEQLWRDLMAPTVQLAGAATVGTGVLLASTPAGAPEEWSTLVLTAWHVARDILADAGGSEALVPVRIYDEDGQAREEPARLVRYEPRLDVAVLELVTRRRFEVGARLAPRERLERLRAFDPVYAVGCPLGNDPIPTYGAIADAHHVVDGERYWMVSAPTYIGNSGGGVFDARTHELIGIFSKIYTHGSLRPTVVPHMGLATPLSEVYDWIAAEGLIALGPELQTAGSSAIPAASPAAPRAAR